jgi:hypothetical protein
MAGRQLNVRILGALGYVDIRVTHVAAQQPPALRFRAAYGRNA